MRRLTAIGLAAAIGLATLALAACSGVGVTGRVAEYVTSGLQTVQPIESAIACEAQRVANQTGAAAQATALLTVDPQVKAGAGATAVGAQLASIVAGTFCNGLAAGAVLPAPILVSGTTSVPLVGGSVTLPVPAVAAKP